MIYISNEEMRQFWFNYPKVKAVFTPSESWLVDSGVFLKSIIHFIAGPAEDCTEWAVAVGEFARADEHKSDDALLQQPYDVLSD